MKLTIIKSNRIVKIDGVGRVLDLSEIPSNVHAIQWDGKKGEIEYIDKPNEKIKSITPYKSIIKAHSTLLTEEAKNKPIRTVNRKLGEIQEEKRKRVEAVVPDKFEMLMRVSFLLNKKIDGDLSTKEIKELNDLFLLNETINKISQAAKTIIIDMETELDPSDYEVESNPLWP